MGINRTSFDAQRRQNREGTHGWASKLIEIELAHIDRDAFKWYQRKFPEFQKLREKADYTNTIVTQEEAFDALSRADSIINCIHSNSAKLKNKS